MKGNNIVKACITNRGWSQSKLADKAGFKSQSNVTGILNRGDTMKLNNFVQMLNAMGYEVVVRDTFGKDEFIVTEE